VVSTVRSSKAAGTSSVRVKPAGSSVTARIV
jgi:hypothetical protein